MYSTLITERRIAAAKKKGHKVTRIPRERSLEIKDALNKLRFSERGEALPKGQLRRELDERERAHILSETILCKADFQYYLSRYHAVELDAGVGPGEGIGPGTLLESQKKFLKELGKREEEVHTEYDKYKMTEGIRVYAHKCRQVTFTSTCRALTMHRMLFYPGTRAFAAALNPDGVGELYKRDKIAIEHLPFWLKPSDELIYPDVKDTELGFKEPFGTRLLYQAESQKAGIGVGTQQDVSHLTEVSLWQYPYQIGFSFAPSLPKTRNTLHIQEATSSPFPYWQTVTEACRRRDRGYESWTYIFVPWYLNSTKWRAIPPANWKPEKHTLEHAVLIERTSPEWCDGFTYRPTAEQLYWWEAERAKYKIEDKLAAFLASYPATPEQSFTNWSEGALPVELLEEMEMDERDPYTYEPEILEVG